MQSLCVLGRQPALGLAELESLYGADKLQRFGDRAVLLNVDPCLLAFDRLGGSIKFCKVLTTLDTIDWRAIEKFLIEVSPEHSKAIPPGKMHLGLSVYGLKISAQRITATALSVKKAIQITGRSVRVVPNQEAALSSAQVIHNHLTGLNGWELVFVRDGNKIICAQTIKEQDITAYTRRDRNRPKRDSRVGMLPPKLSQIIINLAIGTLPEDKLKSICDIPAGSTIPLPKFEQTILDPFCGTGVILQEALLMGYNVFGSDNQKKMVDYSNINLNEWLLTTVYPHLEGRITLTVGDATSYQWSKSHNNKNDNLGFEKIDTVASETYLGRPFIAQPSTEVLAQTLADCNVIIKKFLKNIHGQVSPGTRFCLAIPAWQVRPDEFKHLPLVDSLEELGYNRVSFKCVLDRDLVYYRPDQIVARELLVITRK
ncbi:MAG TPA: hypothetical protein VMR28_01325 [Candidatus Saccharimonadales bacterium]|nr:hypothetical protein [Candidatus Saccharimonadales bacterium]